MRNKAHIAEVAVSRFIQRGFDETTVEEIAHEAGISRRTFFRYFPTKEAAFFSDQERRLLDFKGLLVEARAGEPALERVKRACLEMAALYMKERGRALAQHKAIQASRHLIAYDQRLDAQWEDAIVAHLGQVAPEGAQRDAAWIHAAALLGVIRAVLRRWFAGGCREDLVEMGRDALDVLGAYPLGEMPHN